jgi:hypothetical protein
VKKLLIIQMDGAYFLEETFRVLERFHTSFKDFELTILICQNALKQVHYSVSPLINGITTRSSDVLDKNFDISFNLSMDDASWEFYSKVKSARKMGFSQQQDQLNVPDLWSTFLLTIKANPPFLTFHLQDIYRNILGIKKVSLPVNKPNLVRDLVIGNFNDDFFSLDEREKLVSELKLIYPQFSIRNVLEVDLISDLSHSLYIGPASIQSLRMGELGANCLYLCRNFQGFNLLPYAGRHHLVSSRGESLETPKLKPLVRDVVENGALAINSEYSIYELDHENLFGVYLHSLNPSDDAYPFYQSHVVLWNFLLNLFEVNLEIIKCSRNQIDLISENQEVLTKLIRLHDYAMSSVDVIYHESKAEISDAEKIFGHLENLKSINEVLGKISQSHPMLRPLLNYYRIRRGQNEGSNLSEQIQHMFLTYSEEHHALSALSELLSVNLKNNEISLC